jgi:hypothetical protein
MGGTIVLVAAFDFLAALDVIAIVWAFAVCNPSLARARVEVVAVAKSLVVERTGGEVARTHVSDSGGAEARERKHCGSDEDLHGLEATEYMRVKEKI